MSRFGPKPKPIAERFWSKVDQNGECWLWTAGLTSTGYGLLNGQKAHRLSWALNVGPIPKGLSVCHHCDQPLCVRPDHLFLGTQRDNMHDASLKGRTASGNRNGMRTHPERHPRKLSDGDVDAIRVLRRYGYTNDFIGRLFDVSGPAISWRMR